MKDLFNQISNGLGGLGGLGDKLNGALGGQQKADAPSGQGTGNALGDMVKSAGGLGGLLGSAALGGLLGTLMSGKTARKVAKGALMVGGTAAVGALAWKFYQKWSGANGAAPQGQPAGNGPRQPGPHRAAGPPSCSKRRPRLFRRIRRPCCCWRRWFSPPVPTDTSTTRNGPISTMPWNRCSRAGIWRRFWIRC